MSSSYLMCHNWKLEMNVKKFKKNNKKPKKKGKNTQNSTKLYIYLIGTILITEVDVVNKGENGVGAGGGGGGDGADRGRGEFDGSGGIIDKNKEAVDEASIIEVVVVIVDFWGIIVGYSSNQGCFSVAASRHSCEQKSWSEPRKVDELFLAAHPRWNIAVHLLFEQVICAEKSGDCLLHTRQYHSCSIFEIASARSGRLLFMKISLWIEEYKSVVLVDNWEIAWNQLQQAL